jgi:hypothetical protein
MPPRVVAVATSERHNRNAMRLLRWRTVAWTSFALMVTAFALLPHWLGPWSSLVLAPLLGVFGAARIGVWLLSPASDTFRIP